MDTWRNIADTAPANEHVPDLLGLLQVQHNNTSLDFTCFGIDNNILQNVHAMGKIAKNWQNHNNKLQHIPVFFCCILLYHGQIFGYNIRLSRKAVCIVTKLPHGLPARCVKLRVAHAPEMPGTFPRHGR